MSKIVITIDNIPEKELDNFWKKCIRDARKDFGILPRRSDEIMVDFAELNENYPEVAPEMLGELVGAGIATHCIIDCHKILNA